MKTPGKGGIDDVVRVPGHPGLRIDQDPALRDRRRAGRGGLVRGDRDVNEVKVANFLRRRGPRRSRPRIKARCTGAPVGYAGPIGLPAERPDHRRPRRSADAVNFEPGPTGPTATSRTSTEAGPRVRAVGGLRAGARRRPLPAAAAAALACSARHRGRPHLQARHQVLRGDGLRLHRREGRAAAGRSWAATASASAARWPRPSSSTTTRTASSGPCRSRRSRSARLARSRPTRRRRTDGRRDLRGPARRGHRRPLRRPRRAAGREVQGRRSDRRSRCASTWEGAR